MGIRDREVFKEGQLYRIEPHLSSGDMGRASDETTPSRDHASPAAPLMLILERGRFKIRPSRSKRLGRA